MKKLLQGAAMVALLSTFDLQFSNAHAQGTAFTYQGRLNDGAAPANGSYDVAFSLYATNTGGAIVAGPVTNTGVAVSNGLFITTVDLGNVYGAGDRWLELAVSTNGANAFSPLSPRQALTPVPMAMYAQSASNVLGTVNASQLSGSIPATSLSGTVSLAQLPAGVITNGSSGVNFSGNFGGTFSGNGAGITNVDVQSFVQALGSVTMWGSSGNVDTGVPAGLTNVLAIDGGDSYSLVLKSDGTVVAWGLNNYGQTNIPAGLSNVVSIAAGGYHNLALKNDGTLIAWGNNSSGQTNVPAGLNNVVAIAAGSFHSLALRSDGTVTAWGGSIQSDVPAGLNNVVAIAGGYFHSLALKNDGTVVAWGDNLYGQTNVTSGLSNVLAIAGGYYHSLALKRDGKVVAWGGRFNFSLTNIPSGLSNVVAIAAGENRSLALRMDGAITSWGNSFVNSAGLTNVVSIAAGNLNSFALSKVWVPTHDGSSLYMKFTEEKGKGTAAGGNVAGVNSRNFTNVRIDTHGFGFLSAGDITLMAGTYECRISAPAYRVDEHQIRLRTTTGDVLLYGTSEFSDDALNPGVQSRSLLEGRFTISTTTTLQVQHHTTVVKTGNGLGLPSSAAWPESNTPEVYSVAEFWKIK